jgi:alkylation response protein AidB-like acyl-CoA dehydrogenase
MEEIGKHFVELTEDQKAIRETIKDFAKSRIKPHIMEWDEAEYFPVEVFKELGELGFLGILVPEEFGGSNLGYTEYALIVEELAKVEPGIALSVAAHNGLCTNHINLFANKEQKEKYLPDLATGKKLGAWGLTEPGSGSDAAAMSSTAEKVGNHFKLNGTKNFITHGGVSGTAVVMAITNKEAGHKGISAFVIEKGTPGFAAGKKEKKLGMRISETTQLIMEDCLVPEENLLGKEGEGFKQALKILEGGRISIAALSLGLAEGAYTEAKNYAKERKQFGKTLAEFQSIQFRLADIATQIEAAKLLTFKAAVLMDAGKYDAKAAAMAKLYSSELAVRAANEAVQIFGGYGYVKDYPVEKFYRDAKLLTIGEGTSEIQRIVIGRKITRD